MKPKIIGVLSTPGKHTVFLDGQQKYSGPTEIEAARWLIKKVDGWPDQYYVGQSRGSGFQCLTTFQRVENVVDI
mgnify:CR=1 FL=1